MSIPYLQEADLIMLPRPGMKSAIYWLILLLVTCLIASLFIVETDVTVQTPGIIRPMSEKTTLRSSVNGVVKKLYVKQGQSVKKGELILAMEDSLPSLLINSSVAGITEKTKRLHDLNLLIGSAPVDASVLSGLKTMIYYNEASRHLHLLSDLLATRSKVRKELKTAEMLYQDRVISKKEYEDKQTELTKLESNIEAFKSDQYRKWHEESSELQTTLFALKSRSQEYSEGKSRYELRSPIDGHILKMKALYEGTILDAGEELCEISPDDELIAECYLQTQHIAMIRVDQPVSLQVEAFDYRYFGVLSGTIISVDDDYSVVNDVPVYLVRCRLSAVNASTHSTHSEGHINESASKIYPGGSTTGSARSTYSGAIKKGLRLRVNFIVARRKLSQLLFDQLDDWLTFKIS